MQRIHQKKLVGTFIAISLRLNIVTDYRIDGERHTPLPHILCRRGDFLLNEAKGIRLMAYYDRGAAVRYARRWRMAGIRLSMIYEKIGGDCTNFASQCVYAGSGVMNYTKDRWYYINANNKAPHGRGLKYFYNFMTREDATPGPVAVTASITR